MWKFMDSTVILLFLFGFFNLILHEMVIKVMLQVELLRAIIGIIVSLKSWVVLVNNSTNCILFFLFVTTITKVNTQRMKLIEFR